MSQRRILGRVAREEFVGRDSELARVVGHPSRGAGARGLWLLAAPSVGVSELLRQAFDELFAQPRQITPIYFAFSHRDRRPADLARRFFVTFLQQFIAYRREAPSLCDAPLSLSDLNELAPPGDAELVGELTEAFEQQQLDEVALVHFCFGAPHRAAAAGSPIFPMIDATNAADDLDATITQLSDLLGRSSNYYALAGRRRQVLDLVCEAEPKPDAGELLHCSNLLNDDARRLVELTARRYSVELNGPSCDLIVQQLGASPFLTSALIQAARDAKTPLTSFLNCQRVYVDELMGGRINRYFSILMGGVSPDPETRNIVTGMLYESLLGNDRKSPLPAWKQRLGVDAAEFDRIVRHLHGRELINASVQSVEIPGDAHVWHDYLRTGYLEGVVGESRALVVADTLQHALKRAPRAMARKYRREAALGLRELLAEFNCQTVPGKLFHYDRFAESYKGVADAKVNAGLDAEADLLRVPQVITVAAGAAFAPTLDCDEERCAIAHAFDAGDYTEASELVLIAAEIDSKLEASRELTEEWLNRLAKLADDLKFSRVRIWLVAAQGFSAEAGELLKEREAYSSSRRQVELLAARVKGGAAAKKDHGDANEYDLVVPMGEDTELIAAQAVEQIARRAKFKPAAINQIKTALVEASINAFEHSLSPDRKLYHRFRLEDDKLVITVSSRGVVPAAVAAGAGQGIDAGNTSRRGWGLKLIKSLMDEVAFQQVDDGTELRMVKYRKKK